MSHYHRLYVPGGTWFFTARLADRQSTGLTDNIALLRHCVALARRRWPFAIDAAVVLPDHIHMIWTLPEGDSDYSARWRLIKSSFSAHLAAPVDLTDRQKARGEKGIWQRRFWEHLIRDQDDFDQHRQMILQAPVAAGLVARPVDWAFSSVHRDLAAGLPLPQARGPGFQGRVGQDPPYKTAPL